MHMRLVGEERPRGIDGHPEHVSDVAAAVRHLERLRVVAGTMTGGAGCVDARQEQQLDHDEALALARLAASLRDVEGEAARIVLACPRLWCRGEQLPDVIEQARIRRQVRPRRATDRL